jgi:hypothetical protein
MNQYEQKAWNRQLVLSVGEAYSKIRELPVLSAISYDPMQRPKRWTPDSCHFCADVEHAVRDALKSRADAEELESAWNALVEDCEVIGKPSERLVNLLAKFFDVRGLHPHRYFKPPMRRASR